MSVNVKMKDVKDTLALHKEYESLPHLPQNTFHINAFVCYAHPLYFYCLDWAGFSAVVVVVVILAVVVGHLQLFVLNKQYLQFNRRKRNIFALYDVIAICHSRVFATDGSKSIPFFLVFFFVSFSSRDVMTERRYQGQKAKERPNIHPWKMENSPTTIHKTYRNLSMFHQWKKKIYITFAFYLFATRYECDIGIHMI